MLSTRPEQADQNTLSSKNNKAKNDPLIYYWQQVHTIHPVAAWRAGRDKVLSFLGTDRGFSGLRWEQTAVSELILFRLIIICHAARDT